METNFKTVDYNPYRPQKDGMLLSEEFYNIMSQRRSVRHFSDRPVDPAIIRNAIRTAGTAPSGANKQPWYFAVVTNPVLKEKIKIAAEAVEASFYSQKAPEVWLNDLKPFGTNSSKAHLSEAPALICIFSRTLVDHSGPNPSKTYYPNESTCIATGLLISSLHMSGVCSLTHTPKPMIFLNEILCLDLSFKPLILLAVGYTEDTVKVPDISRLPLTEIMKEY